MRCRMVGRWSVPKTAAAVANSGAAARVVAVAVKWRTWAMRAARTWRTAPMRPGMGRGFACAGVVEAVRVMGMVVAEFGERSENFMMGFIMRLYVGWGLGRGGDHPGRRNRCVNRTKERSLPADVGCSDEQAGTTVGHPMAGETGQASHTEIRTRPAAEVISVTPP